MSECIYVIKVINSFAMEASESRNGLTKTIVFANSILTAATLSLLKDKYDCKKCCLKKLFEKVLTADLQKKRKVLRRTQLLDSAKLVLISEISS